MVLLSHTLFSHTFPSSSLLKRDHSMMNILMGNNNILVLAKVFNRKFLCWSMILGCNSLAPARASGGTDSLDWSRSEEFAEHVSGRKWSMPCSLGLQFPVSHLKSLSLCWLSLLQHRYLMIDRIIQPHIQAKNISCMYI